MTYALNAVERDIDRYAEDRGREQEREDYEDRCIADCKDDLRHLFLHRPDERHHKFSSYTSRQLVDETMDTDKHIPALLEMIRRAALGEDISDDAGDFVLEVCNKCVDGNRETFLRND